MSYLPRDFVETQEGLIFAVVDPILEEGKVLCFLRYVAEPQPRKVDTDAANEFLKHRHPDYLHYSLRLDARLHAVPEAGVRRHYRPRDRLRSLLRQGATDVLEARLCRLVRHFALRGLDPDELGVTGSLLIRAQTQSSDIDLVACSRHSFFAARDIIDSGISDGLFSELDAAAWSDTYQRRGCALGFEEFVWHERRKANKALFEGTKFDLALVATEPTERAVRWCKAGLMTIRGMVTDASAGFDSPARYRIDHPDIPEIVVFTQTYVGQALTGETIEAAGQVERNANDRRRLVVGTSRVAPGEYVRVLRQGAPATEPRSDRETAAVSG